MHVAFDIGGTFTDVILVGAGRVRKLKLLSLYEAVGRDIATSIEEHGGAEVTRFVHGTTVGSNAIIEGTAAETGFVTTEGFRDELEMRGQRRPNVFDVDWQRPPPLVGRSRRLEVRERVLSSGVVEQALDEDGARAVLARLVDSGVRAIAVCLLNSYVNPVHERRIAALFAELGRDDVALCISADVQPEIREYERSSTTVVNASLMPIVDEYLSRIEKALGAFPAELFIMKSNGGLMAAGEARRRPAYIIESGPAAGVIAASRVAGDLGLETALSFDMGGTTAKACLIRGASPAEKPAGEIGAAATMATRMFGGGSTGAGHALRIPSLDIVEVGAGGGSVAWIDDGGALRVGPQSAGAEPGPACYGRGGAAPTVTDANVVLGYINPKALAGDTLAIDRDAAVVAVRAAIAEPLGRSPMEAAWGIVQVANATMMRALRAVSTDRGEDPRMATLVAFGGSGPVHAASLSASMGIRRVIVPPASGVFSAIGLLLAPFRQDYVHAVNASIDEVSLDRIARAVNEMSGAARRDAIAQGVPTEGLELTLAAELKNPGAWADITTALPSRSDAGAFRHQLRSAFTAAHTREFGFPGADDIQLVNLRLRATRATSTLGIDDLSEVTIHDPPAAPRRRPAHFGAPFGTRDCRIASRGELVGPQPGPLLIDEPDTTVVVPPGWTVTRTRSGAVLLEVADG